MKVIPFPSSRMSPEDELALARIEAALDGDGTGAEAELWRELRADVRALPEPLDPAFAAALEQRVRAPRRPQRSPRTLGVSLARRRGPALALAASLIAVLVAVLAFGVSSSSREPYEAAPAARPLVAGDEMRSPKLQAGQKANPASAKKGRPNPPRRPPGLPVKRPEKSRGACSNSAPPSRCRRGTKASSGSPTVSGARRWQPEASSRAPASRPRTGPPVKRR